MQRILETFQSRLHQEFLEHSSKFKIKCNSVFVWKTISIHTRTHQISFSEWKSRKDSQKKACLTLSLFSVVHIPCWTIPNSPSPSVLLEEIDSGGIICFPSGRIYDTGRGIRCSGGEGLRERPMEASLARKMAWKF